MQTSREFYLGRDDEELTADTLGYWARAALSQQDERRVLDLIHSGTPLSEVADWIERAQSANPGW